jgi:DNA (cytosine-5)-methyltransferase 1
MKKPRAYYNENDKKAAQWLRNLIAARVIADGDVDDRSIEEVTPSDVAGYTQCHFFAGVGVWSYALRRAGWPDSRRVWTGSCPCQPFSQARQVGKKNGFKDKRHLYPQWHRLIAVRAPDVVFGEQVSSPGGIKWLDVVRAHLEAKEYAVAALDLCAAGVGAPHLRQRIYFVADRTFSGVVGNAYDAGSQRRRMSRANSRGARSGKRPARPSGFVGGFWKGAQWIACSDGKRRPVEPGTFPLAYGPAARVLRTRAYGNAIVAEQAAAFISEYRAITGS